MIRFEDMDMDMCGLVKGREGGRMHCKGRGDLYRRLV